MTRWKSRLIEAASNLNVMPELTIYRSAILSDFCSDVIVRLRAYCTKTTFQELSHPLDKSVTT